ncbi:MAG TPA: F0F1 ATP synthase subunit A, partial [Aggregatilineales bacterium]|nr:F0F1 ATP synthase subunit A [Aggregatilineales bacterium]
DAAMALPVISVPGEILIKEFPVLGEFTNTMVGTLIADALVLLLIIPVARNLKRVHGRLQMVVELITGLFRNLATSVAGPKNGRRLFPMAATIFIFLLLANWVELVPGVDSVGLIHCAEEGFSGYDTQEFLGMSVLKVSENLDSGTKATHEDYEACEARYHGEEHSEDAAAVATSSDDAEGGDTDADAVAEDGEGSEEGQQAEAEAEAATGEAVEVHDNIRVVTPFIRAAATDLNLTLALALIAVIFIQYLGVAELGWSYPAKFINTPALGKGDVMTFGVGFL